MEDADRVGSPADTRGHGIRQSAGPVQDLDAGLHPDDTLKVAHHQRKRVGSRSGAEAVVGVVGVGHPIPEGFVNGILEGLRSRLHRHDFGVEQSHSRDVERLAGGVHRSHVDHAFQTQ